MNLSLTFDARTASELFFKGTDEQKEYVIAFLGKQLPHIFPYRMRTLRDIKEQFTALFTAYEFNVDGAPVQIKAGAYVDMLAAILNYGDFSHNYYGVVMSGERVVMELMDYDNGHYPDSLGFKDADDAQWAIKHFPFLYRAYYSSMLPDDYTHMEADSLSVEFTETLHYQPLKKDGVYVLNQFWNKNKEAEDDGVNYEEESVQSRQASYLQGVHDYVEDTVATLVKQRVEEKKGVEGGGYGVPYPVASSEIFSS